MRYPWSVYACEIDTRGVSWEAATQQDVGMTWPVNLQLLAVRRRTPRKTSMLPRAPALLAETAQMLNNGSVARVTGVHQKAAQGPNESRYDYGMLQPGLP